MSQLIRRQLFAVLRPNFKKFRYRIVSNSSILVSFMQPEQQPFQVRMQKNEFQILLRRHTLRVASGLFVLSNTVRIKQHQLIANVPPFEMSIQIAGGFLDYDY